MTFIMFLTIKVDLLYVFVFRHYILAYSWSSWSLFKNEWSLSWWGYFGTNVLGFTSGNSSTIPVGLMRDSTVSIFPLVPVEGLERFYLKHKIYSILYTLTQEKVFLFHDKWQQICIENAKVLILTHFSNIHHTRGINIH